MQGEDIPDSSLEFRSQDYLAQEGPRMSLLSPPLKSEPVLQPRPLEALLGDLKYPKARLS